MELLGRSIKEICALWDTVGKKVKLLDVHQPPPHTKVRMEKRW